MKNRIIVISGLAIPAIIFLIYLALPGIIIGAVSAKYGLHTSYRSARITPHFGSGNIRDLSLDIDMRGVNIRRKDSLPAAYDTLDALVSAPLGGTWRYRRIYGTLRPRSGKVLIDTLTAEADEIRAIVKGTFFYSEDKADIDMTIYFSPELLKKVPVELSDTILKDTDGGWRSLSVSVSGDFKSPAIQITGRLFRLNIREVSGS